MQVLDVLKVFNICLDCDILGLLGGWDDDVIVIMGCGAA
jgi:hypothetical protein